MKYIGTYATSGDVQTALNNEELNRPFVAYTTSDGKVYYGADMTLAQVGDIVVYSTSDQLLHFIPQANYNATTYPTASFVPVGIVAAPQVVPLSGGNIPNVTFMGINWLDKNNPDTGFDGNNMFANDIAKMEWGDDTVDISGLTNYSTSGDAITDMTGKANTAAVLEYATGQTGWETAAEITFTNGEKMFPAFECAWRYHTSGTSQGDWYVPSFGQFAFLFNNKQSEINNADLLLNANSRKNIFNSFSYTSTEKSQTGVYVLNTYPTELGENGKIYGSYIRPFCDMPMTAI